MRILLAYGTTEGQTRKIAQFLERRLSDEGAQTRLIDTADAVADLDLGGYDACMVLASLHVGRYQGPVADFVTRHRNWLMAKRAVFVSVSLSAASLEADEQKAIERCVMAFAQETGWTPSGVHHVAGAFRFTQYDFFKRWAMKLIAYEKGMTIPSGQDLELTDWNALKILAHDFVSRETRAAS